MKKSNQTLNAASNNLRILAAAMVEKAKSGHPGGAMGGIDFVNVLYNEFLVSDPADATWRNRDRFFLDPGHMSPMLYAHLCCAGFFTLDEIKSFRQWGSPCSGHPELDVMRGIENTSGPLGQGHVMAVGAAIAERFLVARFGEWMAHKTYAFISDGGVQEEISQGAGRLAGYLGLSNLIMFYDSNDVQLSTYTESVTGEDTAKKYEAWGWNVITIKGNDVDQIRQALTQANAETKRPTLIIGKTIMGLGCRKADGSSFEGEYETHGQPISAAGASMEQTILALGGNPEEPFTIFPETKELYAQRKAELATLVEARQKEEATWRSAHPELASKYDTFFTNITGTIDYAAIVQKQDQATRAASATVLSVLAKEMDNMIVSSADLANSDKTDGFLKQTHPFVPGDFSGAFLHAGVSELTMACVMNGIAAHGGVRCACGTFFVFSDYMKPAIRMSALMGLPVVYVWTHDAFRVGEDGPTHQPIEQEMQIRLMEQLKNHHGQNSMLVLRPADVDEATVAWKMAMENTTTPTGLIFSRQNITSLPAQGTSRYEDALQSAQGAYVVCKDVDPQVVLVANGSEVSTLVAGAALLKERKGVRSQIVSAPSEGLFFNQSPEYREMVIPAALPKFGLTAGLPSSLFRLVGVNGKVWGLDHFGYSAPYTVLDQKFGFTAENVYNQVCELLSI